MSPNKNHDAITEAAVQVLQANPEGMLLSRLGQDVSRIVGESIRPKLGSKRLSDFLRQNLGAAVQFEGVGPHMRVLLRTKEPAARKIVHFEPRFWAAFAKPMRGEGLKRYLDLSLPFEFRDISTSDEIPSGAVEVQSSLIPNEALGRHDRANAIIDSIFAWCSTNNLDPTQFRSQRDITTTPRVAAGVDALRLLVEAVPPEERANHSLTLALIGQLLRQK